VLLLPGPFGRREAAKQLEYAQATKPARADYSTAS